MASRAGTGPGIALIADRNGPSAPTALSATAVLLELAQVYRTLSTTRPLTLISTAGGASGIAAALSAVPPDTEAAIVIGDVARAGGAPAVVPWSTGGGVAPAALRSTVRAALAAALGARRPGRLAARPVRAPRAAA